MVVPAVMTVVVAVAVKSKRKSSGEDAEKIDNFVYIYFFFCQINNFVLGLGYFWAIFSNSIFKFLSQK